MRKGEKMVIKKVKKDKRRFLELLLLADEQESMIEKYLERGTMFVLYEQGLKSICVVTKENEKTCELKNLATKEQYQKQGYGRQFVNYIITQYQRQFETMLVGTGENPDIIRFYESCGFVFSHKIKNFFIDNYDHSMIEQGIVLKDMIYFKKELKR